MEFEKLSPLFFESERVQWIAGVTQRLSGFLPLFPGTTSRVYFPQVAFRPPGKEAEAKQEREPAKSKIKKEDDKSWQKLVKDGEHEAAFDALKNTGARVRNETGELMLAADAARLSGHPREAEKYLKQVIDQHANDSRAPLAAFTLGGMYLRILMQPLKAASMFRKVRDMAPKSALASDALAREVEAWHRAGDKTQANELAKQYLERYPQGSRTRSVKKFGGVD